MRFLATIEDRKNAEAFTAFLSAQNISTHVERREGGETWELWVRDEDKVRDASEYYRQFQEDPQAAKWRKLPPTTPASSEKRQPAKPPRVARSARPVPRGDLVSGRIPPITMTLLVLAVGVSLITGFGQPSANNDFGRLMLNQLQFVVRADQAESVANPSASLQQGEVWRAITPIFLHFSPLHILFNAFMLVSLGRITERLEGPARYLILVLLLAVGSNLLQGLTPERYMGGANFGGMSGVVYGLFGYVWVKTSMDPSIGIALAPSVVIILLAWLVLNMANTFNMNVANLAHLGGLVIGAVLAYLANFSRAPA